MNYTGQGFRMLNIETTPHPQTLKTCVALAILSPHPVSYGRRVPPAFQELTTGPSRVAKRKHFTRAAQEAAGVDLVASQLWVPGTGTCKHSLFPSASREGDPVSPHPRPKPEATVLTPHSKPLFRSQRIPQL